MTFTRRVILTCSIMINGECWEALTRTVFTYGMGLVSTWSFVRGRGIVDHTCGLYVIKVIFSEIGRASGVVNCGRIRFEVCLVGRCQSTIVGDHRCPSGMTGRTGHTFKIGTIFFR